MSFSFNFDDDPEAPAVPVLAPEARPAGPPAPFVEVPLDAALVRGGSRSLG